MASLEISIEPSTDCSAAMSCGGVRSPGLEGRSPGAYDAGPSPQSSSGGSGMLRASWSVTLNVPPDRAVCDPGRDADEARCRHRHPGAGPGHQSGTGTARPPDATSADHQTEAAYPHPWPGPGDNSGLAVDDTPLDVQRPGERPVDTRPPCEQIWPLTWENSSPHLWRRNSRQIS